MTPNHPESRLFERFRFPFDGKQVVLQIGKEFVNEFNNAQYNFLLENYDRDRADQQPELRLTSAYPTIKQHCPRIAVIRNSTHTQQSGLGSQLEEQEIEVDGGTKVRQVLGQVQTDSIEVAVCTLNEGLRDDLFTYLHQYFLDAILHFLPELAHGGAFYDLRVVNAADDQVEFQGAAGQPGFQFYIGRLELTCTYDLLVLKDVDQIKQIFNDQWINEILKKEVI